MEVENEEVKRIPPEIIKPVRKVLAGTIKIKHENIYFKTNVMYRLKKKI